MANVRDIRRRIRSVKNIQQITRAMKFVSASRLRRAHDRVLAARPYANRMLAVLNSIVSRIEDRSHPLLARPEGNRILLLVITGDKGLCGAFNTNILKAAVALLEREHAGKDRSLSLVGRRGVDFFKKRPYRVRQQYVNIMNAIDFSRARAIAQSLIADFVAHDVDAVYLVYNEFKSVMQQRIVVEPLLPIQEIEVQEQEVPIDYIYEQPAREIFDHLLPKHVETQVFRALIESAASEHGARMTAMDAATNNAREVIDTLTLNMNRVRQATITRELIEIASGADALKQG